MDSQADLVRRCQRGDSTAFAPLLRPYEFALSALIRYRIGHPQHAEDVLQEALVQAWTRIGTLKDPGKIGPWLMQIGRNQCRDFFKKAQRREKPTEDAALARVADSDSLRGIDGSYSVTRPPGRWSRFRSPSSRSPPCTTWRA